MTTRLPRRPSAAGPPTTPAPAETTTTTTTTTASVDSPPSAPSFVPPQGPAGCPPSTPEDVAAVNAVLVPMTASGSTALTLGMASTLQVDDVRYIAGDVYDSVRRPPECRGRVGRRRWRRRRDERVGGRALDRRRPARPLPQRRTTGTRARHLPSHHPALALSGSSTIAPISADGIGAMRSAEISRYEQMVRAQSAVRASSTSSLAARRAGITAAGAPATAATTVTTARLPSGHGRACRCPRRPAPARSPSRRTCRRPARGWCRTRR